ncbi:MAG: flagellar biosynthesis protein FlhB [Candidatus Tectimicrobiota bacterium]|nr:MAG: flagellar biosynthesis protein FlhB [Candidatus Tectomicrobia bacterium]
MAETAQERTEAATPRRRQRARQEGQVAKSREIATASLFLGNLLLLAFAGATVGRRLQQLATEAFTSLDRLPETATAVYALLLHYVLRLLAILAPFLVVSVGAALASHLLQSGLVWAPQALVPRLERLSPWQGLQRLVSVQALVELGKALGKVGLVAAVAYITIVAEAEHLTAWPMLEPPALAVHFQKSLLRLGTRTLYPILGLALLDYLWQRWQYEKRLRMTRQELKEERKEDEGDPHVKARIRSLMRTLARRRMMEEVPKADVVITNPTHLAVALRYDRYTMPAPKVVAKGAGLLAERIRAVARRHGVPVVESRAVAQSLYKTVDIGHYIPASLYKAVAEILAYVYRLRPLRAAGLA